MKSESVSLQWTFGQNIAGETMGKKYKDITKNGKENKKRTSYSIMEAEGQNRYKWSKNICGEIDLPRYTFEH